MRSVPHPVASPHAVRRRPTLTITAGPISSGKSEWVRSFHQTEGSPLCLVRDEVRTKVGGEGYLDGLVDGEVEEAVTRLIREQCRNALARGVDVYMDGCHNHPLTRRQWESFATKHRADFRLMFFNRSLDEIVALNAARESPHPREKIESSHRQWEEQFERVPRRPQHQFIDSGNVRPGNSHARHRGGE